MDNLKAGNVDRVFAFRLTFAIRNFNKNELENAADSTFLQTPANEQQVVVIKNHDMPRFATVEKSDPGKLRIGATLNLLMVMILPTGKPLNGIKATQARA